MPTNLFKFMKCPAPAHREIVSRVRCIDFPSLRDDEYALRRYLDRKISYSDYLDVVNFMPIYVESHNRKLNRVRLHLYREDRSPSHQRSRHFLSKHFRGLNIASRPPHPIPSGVSLLHGDRTSLYPCSTSSWRYRRPQDLLSHPFPVCCYHCSFLHGPSPLGRGVCCCLG